MKTLLIVLFCLIMAPSFAQQQIKIDEAKNHVGDSVKICSKIYDTKYFKSSQDPITLLDMGDKYPNNPLSIVIPADVRKLFKTPPEEYYKGAHVCVTGKIQIYKEKPEIVIRSAEQIQEVIMDKSPVKGPA
jgi:hypothetical protein